MVFSMKGVDIVLRILVTKPPPAEAGGFGLAAEAA